MITTVLFDFDGTLVNTNDLIIASWQYTYKHYLGHEVSLEHIVASFGEVLPLTMAREFPDVDTDEACNVYRDYQLHVAEEMIKTFEGIPDLLKELNARGYRVAIVTSRTRESALRYLDMLEISGYFEDLVTCDDTNKHKPDPEPILVCLRKLGVTADEAVMVGDSPFDMKCANNAGVKSVLVDWRITDSEKAVISDAVVDYEIATPMDLIDVLRELSPATGR
jgi:pyrophosphatase PpaX